MKDRYICTPLEWQQNYWPTIQVQVSQLMQIINKSGVRPAPPPINATSPLLNNPAGVPISLGKHSLRQEDLHIPDSKRRRSGVAGMSASPTSTADPASVPAISQTPITAGTPTTHPMSTPVVPVKRPSTGSPVTGQLPPNKVQVGVNGSLQTRDKAVDEAVAKRLAKEEAEELEKQEARKNPLEYAKNAVYKVVGRKNSDQSGVAALPQPVMQGLADKIRNVGISESTTSETPAPNGITRERSSTGQKAQLPSPPWSGTITPRQLAETFANTTDIEFALKSLYPVKEENTDELDGFSMMDTSVNSDEDTEKLAGQELSDLDFLSPLVGESGWDDAYSWTKNLPIPWNGDINTIFEQPTNLGVVA
jgi:hypothetical protein